MAEIDPLLDKLTQTGASDLHLKSGLRPWYRLHGELEEMTEFSTTTREDVERLTQEILTEEHKKQYAAAGELDFSYDRGKSRLRCKYFLDRCGPAAVFRRIPTRVPSIRDLNLPPSVESFAHLKRGLILVTGSTGSGKTSTLAALLNVINETYNKHIITLEDPIEYLHPSKKSVIHQRGMHYDITDFESGLIASLRQDPDVILIGELRELESIRLALTAAEIGLLVFSTLHTNSAADAIDRVIDVFPAGEQAQVRTVLSQSLAGVISQVLLTRKDQPGRFPATEILRSTPAVSNLIRENKIQELINNMQSGKNQGMHTMDDSLISLVQRNVVSAADAFSYARNKAHFESLVANEAPANERGHGVGA